METKCFPNLAAHHMFRALALSVFSRVIFITLVYLWARSSGRYFSGLVNKT